MIWSMYKEIFEVPGGENKTLMHSCCAPCSGPLIEKMAESGIDLNIFSIIPMSIPKRNMNCVKKKIFAMLKTWTKFY